LYMTIQWTFLPSLVQICFVVSGKKAMTRLNFNIGPYGKNVYKSSPLKPVSQFKANMAWMVLRWSTFKIMSCPPKDHSCHVCFKLTYWFQRRRLLNIFSIGSYVKIKSSHGGHLEFPISKRFADRKSNMAARAHNVFWLVEIFKIFLLETTKPIELWLCRNDHWAVLYPMLKICLLMVAILDGGRGHRT
jgi:hypothetical protein